MTRAPESVHRRAWQRGRSAISPASMNAPSPAFQRDAARPAAGAQRRRSDLQRARQRADPGRALAQRARRPRLGSHLRRRRFPRRHRRRLRARSARAIRACAASIASVGAALPRPASRACWRPQAPLRRRDGRRPAARRDPAAGDARARCAAATSTSSVGEPLRRRRRRRRARERAARSHQQAGRRAVARRLLGVDLTDPMSGFFMMRRDRVRRAGAAAVDRRASRSCSTSSRPRRGDLRIVELPYRVPRAPARREQARRARRARLPRAAARQADRTTRSRCASCCSAWSG